MCLVPTFTIGSIAKHIPSFNSTFKSAVAGLEKFGTWGLICNCLPIPWPTNSLTIEKPSDSTYSCIELLISNILFPTTAFSIPISNAFFVTFNNLCFSSEILPTANVRAESL